MLKKVVNKRTVHSRSDRIARLVDKDAGIIIKFHKTSIGSLNLLASTHDNCMSNIAATHLVGDSAVCRVFGTKVSLFLDDDDDAVA